MIPLLIGAGIAGLLGAGGMSVAKDTQEEAEATLKKAQKIYNDAKKSLEAKQHDMEKSLKDLGEEKYKVLVNLIPRFVKSFERFKNFTPQESVEIDDFNNLKIDEFSYSDLVSLRELAETGSSLAKGTLAGGAAGASIALGAGTLFFDSVAGAGFMAEFASFAGIGAAADLALVGVGGLVPGLAIVAGPALLIGGFAQFCKADENLEKAKTALAESKAAAEKMSNSEYMCSQIERRSDMFYNLLYQLEPIFEASINELERICSKIFVGTTSKNETKAMKKGNFNNLTADEQVFLRVSGSIAKAVKAVVVTPILDSNGYVTNESEEVHKVISKEIIDHKEQQQLLLEKIHDI